jgi:ATP-dependent Clp protease ATP-binding subunit ClpA
MKASCTLFSRFSPAAKRILRAAEQASRNHNHYYVGVEHVLLALLEEHDPAVDERLRAHGVACDRAQEALRRALGTGDDRLWDGILVTPRVRSVVRLAESAVQPSALVEPVDLFDAIWEEGGSLAREILDAAGAAGNAADSHPVAG